MKVIDVYGEMCDPVMYPVKPPIPRSTCEFHEGRGVPGHCKKPAGEASDQNAMDMS